MSQEPLQFREEVELPHWLWECHGGPDPDKEPWPDDAWGVTPCLKVPCMDETVHRIRNPWGWPSFGTAEIADVRAEKDPSDGWVWVVILKG